jgi:hypothetical protein
MTTVAAATSGNQQRIEAGAAWYPPLRQREDAGERFDPPWLYRRSEAERKGPRTIRVAP